MYYMAGCKRVSPTDHQSGHSRRCCTIFILTISLKRMHNVGQMDNLRMDHLHIDHLQIGHLQIGHLQIDHLHPSLPL